MRREITQLRTRQRRLEEVLAAVAPQEVSNQLLNNFPTGSTLEGIGGHSRVPTFTSAAVGNNVTTYSQPSDFQAINHALQSAQNAGNISDITHYDPFANTFLPSFQGHQPGSWSAQSGASMSSSEMLSDNQQNDMMNWALDPAQSLHPSHPAVGIWEVHPENAEVNGNVQTARSRGQDIILRDTNQPELSWEDYSPRYRRQSWTTVTDDKKVVEHLLALYFCWEYPTFASLSKKHFMDDFRQGIPRYCSPLLVNALLALGCRFSDQPIARADPNDSRTTGDHFFAEAMKLFETEGNHRVLTTIQALGIMSIREASCGRVEEGIYLSGQSIRLAMEMGLHLEAEDDDDNDDGDDHRHSSEDADNAVRQATFWGAFSLDE